MALSLRLGRPPLRGGSVVVVESKAKSWTVSRLIFLCLWRFCVVVAVVEVVEVVLDVVVVDVVVVGFSFSSAVVLDVVVVVVAGFSFSSASSASEEDGFVSFFIASDDDDAEASLAGCSIAPPCIGRVDLRTQLD